jgi:hypothetical protein
VTPPERLAPDGVPHAAAHFLDNAVVYLKPLAKEEGLALQPYDAFEPGNTRWLHGMYGKANDREFCVQVVTDEALATEFRAVVNGWIRIYPRDGRNEWIHLLADRAAGMHELVRTVAETVRLLRIVCVLAMPHPKRPDPKA